MIFRTDADEFYNMSQFYKFFVEKSEDSEFWLIAEIPTSEELKPNQQIIATADSRDDAVEFLSEIMRRMAKGWNYCSYYEIREELNKPYTPIEETF
jgi:hypothetical protein